MPRAPQDVYARLLSSPRGYPLWTPEPSNELLMERRDGLRIGDVGVVIPDDGGFDVFFNICLPPDHPFHRRYGVPEGFICIDQSELDIRTIPNAEHPGRIISTSSVARVGAAEPSSDAPQRDESSALPYKFSLSSNEGALLILPNGAERYELLNEGLFLEQASRHGAEWYNYAMNRRHRIISHDSLYMITGIYKARSWSVAAFENTTGNEHHAAHFKQIEGGTTAPTYSWETTRALDWRVGPYMDYGIPNQAVFIRGFKIALRSGFFGTRRWISVEADTPSTRPSPAKWSSNIPSNSRLLGSGARSSRNREDKISRATMRDGRTTDPPEERPHSDDSHLGRYDDMYIEIQRVPDVPKAFHPSDAINRYLLLKEPSANIAITHDSHWISILEDGSVTPNEFGQELRLETVLSQNYRIVSQEGVVRLERKGNLDGDVPYATTATDPERADKQSPPMDTSDMDSQTNADPQILRNIASRIVSLALQKMNQDVGLREIGAILHNTVEIENASLNITTPSPLVLHEHAGITTFVAFLPPGDRILSASKDGTVRSRSVLGGEQKVINGMLVQAITVSYDGQRVATGEKDGKVRVWDVSMSQEISRSAGGHLDAVRSLSFSPDSTRVASGAQDGTVFVWRTTTGELVAESFVQHKNCVCAISYAPDGKRIASCDKEMVQIHRDDSVLGLTIIEKACSLAWLPDGDGLFVGCTDGSIKYFDSSTGLLLAVWVCHGDAVLSIALSHSGKFFASASRDSTVRIWETATRYQVGATLWHNSSIHSITISPDDRQLVSGAWNSCLHLWDLRKVTPSLFKDLTLASDQAFMQQTDTRPPLTPERKISTDLPILYVNRFLGGPRTPRKDMTATPAPFDKDKEEKSLRSLDDDKSSPLQPRARNRVDHPVKYGTKTNYPTSDSRQQLPLDAPLPIKFDFTSLSEELKKNRPPVPRRGDKATTNDETAAMARSVYGIPPDLPLDLTGLVLQDDNKLLSFGITGEVYRGTLKVNLRSIQVAIKVIPMPLARDNSAFNQKKLHREIEVLLKPNHINVLPFLGVIEIAGLPALVYPWTGNVNLPSYLERDNNNLTTPLRLVLINDVAMGLQHLHSQSITHGNLFDSNVIIRSNGRACIANFGLLPLTAELQGLSLAEVYAGGGALRWAAPELLPDNEGNVPTVVPTPKSDVYSFGGIMLQVLTGKPPYGTFGRGGVLSLKQKGELPMIPMTLVTDNERAFLLRCWSAVDGGKPRPSSTEIVGFMKEQLIEAVMSKLQDSRGSDDSVTLTATDGPMKYYLCDWVSDGKPCNTPILGKELATHFSIVHADAFATQWVSCLWGDCGLVFSKASLIRHLQAYHLRFIWPCPKRGRSFTLRDIMEKYLATRHVETDDVAKQDPLSSFSKLSVTSSKSMK